MHLCLVLRLGKASALIKLLLSSSTVIGYVQPLMAFKCLAIRPFQSPRHTDRNCFITTTQRHPKKSNRKKHWEAVL